MPQDPYEMLYCDTASCRVNTFEAGDGADAVNREAGLCPGCNQIGHRLSDHQPHH